MLEHQQNGIDILLFGIRFGFSVSVIFGVFASSGILGIEVERIQFDHILVSNVLQRLELSLNLNVSKWRQFPYRESTGVCLFIIDLYISQPLSHAL